MKSALLATMLHTAAKKILLTNDLVQDPFLSFKGTQRYDNLYFVKSAVQNPKVVRFLLSLPCCLYILRGSRSDDTVLQDLKSQMDIGLYMYSFQFHYTVIATDW